MIVALKPRSIRADVSGPAVAPVASASANIDAATPASAKAPAAAPAMTVPTAPTSGLGLRGGCSHQDGRGADDVDEHQSQRCKAAREDIVAFSHSSGSPVIPNTRTFGCCLT